MSIRLNLACGRDLRYGWVNIDMLPPLNIPAGVDYVQHDLRKGLPDQFRSVNMITMSHVSEHLTTEDNITLLRHCYKRMVPGGSLFIELPDFVSVIKAYLDKDWNYFRHPAIMHFCKDRMMGTLLDYALHQRVNGIPEHITFIDSEIMIYILREAGFTTIHETKFCPGISNPDPLRIKYSLYFEAIK